MDGFVDSELLSLLRWPYGSDLVLYLAFMEQVEVVSSWSMVHNDILYKTLLYLVARYFPLGFSNITRYLFALCRHLKDFFIVMISKGFYQTVLRFVRL